MTGKKTTQWQRSVWHHWKQCLQIQRFLQSLLPLAKKGSFHVILFFNPDTHTHTLSHDCLHILCVPSAMNTKHMKLHAGHHNGDITALWVIPSSFIPASLLSTLCASSPVFTPVTLVCHLNKRREKHWRLHTALQSCDKSEDVLMSCSCFNSFPSPSFCVTAAIIQ